MKPFKILTPCLFLFVTTIAQPVKNWGHLKVVGTQLCAENGKPIALHGLSFGWSCFHPRFYNAGVVHTLHTKWNCSVLRAAMGVEPKGGYLQFPDSSKKLVKNAVDAAIKEGIYVIIDWHCHHTRLPEAKAFFAEMATAYGKYPNVIFELYNEPEKAAWPEIKAYSAELIKTIRATGTQNIILVGCPKWDQEIDKPAEDPIVGYSNIMYTMHFYAGTHKQWLRNRTDSAMKKGIPVFVSESAGMDASGNGPLDVAEWQKYMDWMNANKLSWVTWSVSDKDETCSILQPSAASNGNWKEGDIKESGKATRKYLLAYPSVDKK